MKFWFQRHSQRVSECWSDEEQATQLLIEVAFTADARKAQGCPKMWLCLTNLKLYTSSIFAAPISEAISDVSALMHLRDRVPVWP
jgi:hypothetical protein